jgi:hypothetical protein
VRRSRPLKGITGAIGKFLLHSLEMMLATAIGTAMSSFVPRSWPPLISKSKIT